MQGRLVGAGGREGGRWQEDVQSLFRPDTVSL